MAERYPVLSIRSLIRAREIVAICVVVLYFAWVIVGHRKVRGIGSVAMSTTMSYLGDFYAAVPQRFVKPHVHRFDAFSTGRTHHRGVLTSVVLTKRCDPLGFLLDLVLRRKSRLVFEFVLDISPDAPMLLHIGPTRPTFADAFALAECSVNDERLKCFTDLGDARHAFLAMFNAFVERHPGMLRMAEISDANRFELVAESRYVARIEFQARRNGENAMFGRDVVDFAVAVADKFAAITLPDDIARRNGHLRMELIRGSAEDLQKAKTD